MAYVIWRITIFFLQAGDKNQISDKKQWKWVGKEMNTHEKHRD